MDDSVVYFYIVSIAFQNGSQAGWKIREIPFYNEIQDCFCFTTLDGTAVRAPIKNIATISWKPQTWKPDDQNASPVLQS